MEVANERTPLLELDVAYGVAPSGKGRAHSVGRNRNDMHVNGQEHNTCGLNLDYPLLITLVIHG